jgi:hypothetical protein
MAAMTPVATFAAALLPSNTIVPVTTVNDISSKGMKVGDVEALQVASDVFQEGVVIIPRGSPVKATVTWHTGKAVGGKSAKFELTFNTVSVHGRDYALTGKHRQEGKGNTVAALLGSMIISGHSAIMTTGQVINAVSAEPISAS